MITLIMITITSVITNGINNNISIDDSSNNNKNKNNNNNNNKTSPTHRHVRPGVKEGWGRFWFDIAWPEPSLHQLC